MKIKLVVFDFDRVFTNEKYYFDSYLNIKKYYDIKDGMGLKILIKSSTKIVSLK